MPNGLTEEDIKKRKKFGLAGQYVGQTQVPPPEHPKIISGSDVSKRPAGQPLLTGEGAKVVREQRARAEKQRKRKGALSKMAMLVLGGRYSSVVD